MHRSPRCFGCKTSLRYGSVEGMSTQPILPDPRYPIGKFSAPASLTSQQRTAAIETIEELPGKLRAAVAGLTEAQLDTAYRDGGWSVRQTVHHVADSHSQASSRVRMAMTEDWPTVVPYRENLWAELADARTLPVEISLQLLDALHARWVTLLRSVKQEDWAGRGYRHPENGLQSLEGVAVLYAWHGRHHTAHITALRERMGW